MNWNILALVGSTAVGVLALSTTAGAATANIVTPGAACTNQIAGEGGFFSQAGQGVRNDDPKTPHNVFCPVARHSMDSTTVTTESYYVDGCNIGSNQSLVMMLSFNYDGTFQSSVTDTPQGNGSTSCTSYDHKLSLSTVTEYSYVTLGVQLPPNRQGIFYGVTSIEQ